MGISQLVSYYVKHNRACFMYGLRPSVLAMTGSIDRQSHASCQYILSRICLQKN